MAIATLPPVCLTACETADIATLQTLILTLATVLNNEARIALADRLLSTDAVTSINNTIIDSSDRLDAIINPIPPLP